MQTLYFVKLRSAKWEEVKFCLTAADEEAAGKAGLEGVADAYQAEFRVVEVTPICVTPDTVERFEPV